MIMMTMCALCTTNSKTSSQHQTCKNIQNRAFTCQHFLLKQQYTLDESSKSYEHTAIGLETRQQHDKI